MVVTNWLSSISQGNNTSPQQFSVNTYIKKWFLASRSHTLSQTLMSNRECRAKIYLLVRNM